MIILEAKNVTKRFPNEGSFNTALDNISLSIYEKEFLIIMGPSGSGKSTFLNLLSGIDSPSFGVINYKGKTLSEKDKRTLALYRQKVVGIVFQLFNLIDKASVKFNVEYPRLLTSNKLNTKSYDSKIILNDLQIKSDLNLSAYNLSTGEQQRVAIARALINNPEIILADEPTGSLDSENADNVMKILKKINTERGKTVVLVTHNPHLTKYADRIIYMKDGKIESTEILNEEMYKDNDLLVDKNALSVTNDKSTIKMNVNLLNMAYMNVLSNLKETLVLSLSIGIATASILLLSSCSNLFNSSFSVSNINEYIWVIGALSIIGVFFEIINLLSSYLTLRIREIGILRALGIRDKHILLSFLYEGMITGIIGSIFSIIITLVDLYIFSNIYFSSTFSETNLSINYTHAVIIGIAAIFTCLIAAYYPMLQVLQKPIIEILNRNE